MIDGAGSVGFRNWQGLILRKSTENWIKEFINNLREGQIQISQSSPAHTIAFFRDQKGDLLNTSIAAIELINLLRPTVAVAHYIMFAALALHNYPLCKTKIKEYSEDYLAWFVNEVRRFYPFFPVVGGHVLKEFEWRDYKFKKGEWVFLDLYGTNHDKRIWNNPEIFEPERFRSWNGSAYSFIPQGGGDFYTGHRCAGEWLTIELMKKCTELLISNMEYEIPYQDLSIDFSRFPALPTSHLILKNIKSKS